MCATTILLSNALTKKTIKWKYEKQFNSLFADMPKHSFKRKTRILRKDARQMTSHILCDLAVAWFSATCWIIVRNSWRRAAGWILRRNNTCKSASSWKRSNKKPRSRALNVNKLQISRICWSFLLKNERAPDL